MMGEPLGSPIPPLLNCLEVIWVYFLLQGGYPVGVVYFFNVKKLINARSVILDIVGAIVFLFNSTH